MPKHGLRRKMLAQRRSLSGEEVRSASRIIQRTFLESDLYRRAGVLAVYSPIHNEVETEMVVRAALEAEKLVALPAVEGHELVFRQVKTDTSLQSGTFGILEPCIDCSVYRPEQIDVFVLPGVAFDLSGERIGYGKGFYDKTVHRFEGQGKLVGFCYDFQLVERIVGEAHDVRMDVIITEKRVVRPPGN